MDIARSNKFTLTIYLTNTDPRAYEQFNEFTLSSLTTYSMKKKFNSRRVLSSGIYRRVVSWKLADVSSPFSESKNKPSKIPERKQVESGVTVGFWQRRLTYNGLHGVIPPVDRTLHNHRWENLESSKRSFVLHRENNNTIIFLMIVLLLLYSLFLIKNRGNTVTEAIGCDRSSIPSRDFLNLTLFILVRHTSKLNYRIIIVNTVQCDSICRYLLPLHVSVSITEKTRQHGDAGRNA
jgi:hypothetical protein